MVTPNFNAMSFNERMNYYQAAYKGSEVVPVEDSPLYPKDGVVDEKFWVQHFILTYGDIDGAHHKDWVLDQVMRIVMGTPVEVQKKTWDDGKGWTQTDYTVHTGNPSEKYLAFRKEMEAAGCWHEVGIAP